MYSFAIAITTAFLAISSSLAVEVEFGFDSSVLACEGDTVTVKWQGYHDIRETSGSDCDSGDIGVVEFNFFNSGTERTYSDNELTASPGQRRYFKCSAHCGPRNNRFEVYCPQGERSPAPTEAEGERSPAPTEAEGERSPAPTEAPAPCVDSGLPLYYEGNFYTCNLLGGFCTNRLVASHCPLTCNSCVRYKCLDSMAPLNIGGGEITCDIAEDLDDEVVASYCASSDDLLTTCRASCAYCGV